MTTTAENERMTQVGAGTPGGELMRRYWQPIATVSMLDEEPVREVKLLGEDLVLYRDLSGDYGLVGAHCAHRLVNLRLGLPEQHGLRCPYHGWCYDATGQCTETPLEAANSRLKDRIKIPGYPVQEMGGLLFAYLGPLPAPILPPWDFLVWPNAIRQVGFIEVPCNWLQSQENVMDPFHGRYLHGDLFKYELEKMGVLEERAWDKETHRLWGFMRRLDGHDGVAVERDRFGFKKGVRFSKKNGAKEDHVAWYPPLVFPNLNPARGTAGAAVSAIWRIPRDDGNTLHIFYYMYFSPGIEVPKQESVPYFNVPLYDEKGAPILDYVSGQDFAAYISEGAITDRTQEHLASTDLGVIEFRKMLEEQMELVEAGKEPSFNIFRERSEVGEMLILDPPLDSNYTVDGIHQSAKTNYHKGYWQDELDRYGPATELAIELSRQTEERYIQQQAEREVSKISS